MNQNTENKNHDENISRYAREEILKLLPQDLLPQVTVLFQDSGYVTISPKGLMRPEWIRINDKVRQMGGQWVRNGRQNHWSIPFSRNR